MTFVFLITLEEIIMAIEFFQRATSFGSHGTATKIMHRIKELAGFEGYLFVYERDTIVKNIESAFLQTILHHYEDYQTLTSEKKDEIREKIAQLVFEASKNECTKYRNDKTGRDYTRTGIHLDASANEKMVREVRFPDVFTSHSAESWLITHMKKALSVTESYDDKENNIAKFKVNT